MSYLNTRTCPLIGSRIGSSGGGLPGEVIAPRLDIFDQSAMRTIKQCQYEGNNTCNIESLPKIYLFYLSEILKRSVLKHLNKSLKRGWSLELLRKINV